MNWRNRSLVAALASSLAAFLAAAPAEAQEKSLTLCWAAWDPANALVELGKDFTKQTGIEMKYEFVPWTSYADRFINELNSHSKLCDLIIGDSQWIGGSAENGHYVKLNDFFAKEHISMDDFMPATVRRLFGVAEEHAELLGAAGDGRRGRLDLPQGLVRQARASRRVQAEIQSRARAAEDLGRAARGRQVLHRQGDRRQEGLRIVHLHRARLGRHHDGRDQRDVRLRLPVRRPEAPLPHGRLRQLAGRDQGARRLQGALQVLPAAGPDQRLHAGRA